MHCPNCEEYIKPSDLYDLRPERLEAVRSSTFHKETVKRLSDLYGLPEKEVFEMADIIFQESLSFHNKEIGLAIRHFSGIKAQEYIDGILQDKLNELYGNAVEKGILLIDPDGKLSDTNIIKHAYEKIKQFIESVSGYDGKRRLEETLDKLIEERVAKQIDEVLEEIKKESIEKFNKAAMKQMMLGMAKAIGEDKKLLTLLDM